VVTRREESARARAGEETTIGPSGLSALSMVLVTYDSGSTANAGIGLFCAIDV
jgi:hypothetical protein